MTIIHLRQTAHLAPLDDHGTPERPDSEPPCRLSGLPVELVGTNVGSAGVWECSPGRFHRVLAEAEVMHVLSGRGRFEPLDGPPVAFEAGDTLFFPAHTRGTWQIDETMRKVYALFPPD